MHLLIWLALPSNRGMFSAFNFIKVKLGCSVVFLFFIIFLITNFRSGKIVANFKLSRSVTKICLRELSSCPKMVSFRANWKMCPKVSIASLIWYVNTKFFFYKSPSNVSSNNWFDCNWNLIILIDNSLISNNSIQYTYSQFLRI